MPHSETYSLLIDTYIKDPAECRPLWCHTLRLTLYSLIPTSRTQLSVNTSLMPSKQFLGVECKANCAMKWISDKNSTFAECLIVFTGVKGVFFSGSFTSIPTSSRSTFWITQRPTLIIQIHQIIWQHRRRRACKYSFSLNFPDHDCLHPAVSMRISEWVDIVLGASWFIFYHSYIRSLGWEQD